MAQMWSARVEWNPDAEYDVEQLGDLINALADHHAAIGQERDGTCSAQISVEAGTLRQAIAAALGVVEEATGCKATGAEVLDEAAFDARLLEPTLPDLVGLAEIADICGVSRQRALQLQERPDFPPAVAHLRSGGPIRVRQHVEAWAAKRNKQPGRPRVVTA